jgi:hypothetical protein
MKEFKILFKERTTWVGVGLLLFAGLSTNLSPELQLAIVSAGAALIARNENVKLPR